MQMQGKLSLVLNKATVFKTVHISEIKSSYGSNKPAFHPPDLKLPSSQLHTLLPSTTLHPMLVYDDSYWE